MEQPVNAEDGGGAAGSAALRLFRPDKPVLALGLAVNHLMTKPAFANLGLGAWSRILVGQINRGHYAFVVDGDRRIQGFIGWALTTRDKAESWVEGRGTLSYEDCTDGDCVVFNAWSANSAAAHRFILQAARGIVKDKETIYFKRYYADGSSRPVRLSVNDFIGRHIERATSSSPGLASPPTGVASP